MDEQVVTVRMVLIAVMVVILPIGVYHRFTSQSTGEKLDRRQEGLFVLATLRPLGAVFWCGMLAWMINPRWMAWSSVATPLWSRWAGVVLVIAGAVLLIWTFRSLGTNLTDTVVTRTAHTLVVHGPYRWIRHPLYSSAGLMIAALSLIAANWFLLIIGVAVLCVIVMRTRTEEQNLVARFGDSYRKYMDRTGRFLPRFG
jgi:protein-S-isoprenylcysteine O-methyltransferase Ste14